MLTSINEQVVSTSLALSCNNIQPQSFLILENILYVFTIYRYGGHLYQWSKTFGANFQFHFNRRIHIFGENWSFVHIMILYFYIAQAGADNPSRGQNLTVTEGF